MTSGNGAAVLATQKVDDPATGLEIETQSIDSTGAVVGRILRHYDGLGRIDSYTDADGNVTRTTYDLLSRVVAVGDGRYTRTYHYDGGAAARTDVPTAPWDAFMEIGLRPLALLGVALLRASAVAARRRKRPR